ncbi:MAG: class I SAM-dependent methyltransferase [Actinobacteria bacterium]|nr:class I SAM-dependent methyltransferase [Actinomycetota bacterium]
MERILEPEIMDNKKQVITYAKADFSLSNQMFVDKLIADYYSRLKNVLDIGCGPADVPIRLAKAMPSVCITAIDASDPMIQFARKQVNKAGLEKQIKVIKGHLPGLVLENNYDAILSKDLLHHLPNPIVFWDEVKHLAKGETVIYVMDLFRPRSKEEARNIVESVSGNETPILKQDFYNSLLAAFTINEIKAQICEDELNLEVEKVSERHFIAKGLIRGNR